MIKLTDYRTGLPVYLSGYPKSIVPAEPINYPAKEGFDKTPYTVVRLHGSEGLFGQSNDIYVSVKESPDEVKAAFDTVSKNTLNVNKPLGGTDETTIEEYRELVKELNQEIVDLQQEIEDLEREYAELEEDFDDYIDTYDEGINIEYYVSKDGGVTRSAPQSDSAVNSSSANDSLNSKVRDLINWLKNF